MNSVEEWRHSTDAFNVIDRFHGVKFVVYVEGRDDILFWSTLFNKAKIDNYYIDDAGGTKELEKIMFKILHENARVIVACDCHYSRLLNNLSAHERIINTFGYSIENVMTCPHKGYHSLS